MKAGKEENKPAKKKKKKGMILGKHKGDVRNKSNIIVIPLIRLKCL